jgi:hypothetical protein
MINPWRMRWAGNVAHMRKKSIAYRILVGNPEGRRPLGTAKRRWRSNIKIDFREINLGGMNWIHLAQDRDQLRGLLN